MEEKPKLSNRLLSLDALRGFDMLWIMGADWLCGELAKVFPNSFFAALATQMEHVEWHGFHMYDLIFPLFLFMSGVAAPYSVGRELEKGTSQNKVAWRVIKRSLILVLLGVIYNNGLNIKPIAEYRFCSVLGRIGLAYMFACLIYVYTSKNIQRIACVSLLLFYWVFMKLLSAPGFAAGDMTMEGNIVSYIDRTIMPGKLYLGIHDPEGFFSTIPAISTGLLGIFTGDYLKTHVHTKSKKALHLFLASLVCFVIAWLWNFNFPINKNLWTSSFVMQTAAWSFFFLSIFYYIIDVLGYVKWAFFFKVIGMNSILIYLSDRIINWQYATNGLFKWAKTLAPEHYKELVFIITFLATKWIFLYIMYRKKIFLKV